MLHNLDDKMLEEHLEKEELYKCLDMSEDVSWLDDYEGFDFIKLLKGEQQ